MPMANKVCNSGVAIVRLGAFATQHQLPHVAQVSFVIAGE